MVLAELELSAPPEITKIKQKPDGFTELSRLARKARPPKGPTNSIDTEFWTTELGLQPWVFEHLMFVGYIHKLEHNEGDFKARTLDDILNFQVPRLLHNAAEIIRDKNAKGERVPQGVLRLADPIPQAPQVASIRR